MKSSTQEFHHLCKFPFKNFGINKLYMKRRIASARMAMEPITIFSVVLIIANLMVCHTAKATIAQRGTATSGTTTNTTLTINKPAGVVAGDVMIANICQTGNYVTDASANGWTIIDGASLGNTNARYATVLYRVADGTEGTSIIFTLGSGTNGAIGSIIAFSGVNISGVTPFDATLGIINTSSTAGTTVTALSITTNTDNSAVIFLGEANNSTWSNWSGSAPTFTEVIDVQNTTANLSVAAAWGTLSTAGAIGNKTATVSNTSYWGGILISLKAAPEPGSTVSTIYDYSGSTQTFTVPNCVTSVKVEAWGGGGAGGGTNNTSRTTGGGGGGGTYTYANNVTVTPGAGITVNVGVGGFGASNAAGGTGGTSTFNSTPPVSAVGGYGGGVGNGSPLNGAGASIRTGVTYDGGMGGTGNATTLQSGTSGGGGGGAGSGGDGNTTNPGTSGGIGGIIGTGYSAGGDGANGTNTSGNGTAATELAAGGSGGRNGGSGATNRTGGNGAPGIIVVTYTLPNNPTITLGANPSVTQGTTTANLPYTATTGCPDQYNIIWDGTALGQGFSNVTNATLPDPSPIVLSVPGGAAPATYNGTLTVTNSTYGFTSTTYSFTVTITSLTPTITGFSPPSACAGSGVSVVITGTNFTGVTAVTFYNGQAASFTVNSNTQITATLPAGAITGTIKVTTPGGTATSAGSFTVYTLPTVTTPATTPVSYCRNATATPLSVTGTAGSGTITSYAWYSNTTQSNSGGTLLVTHSSSSTTDTYTPVTTSTGTLYYYVIISNSNSCTATSSASNAVTVNALPTVTTPATTPVSYCQNAAATALSVTGTAGSGTISSYAWYSNTTQSNSGGTLVATHTSSSTTDTYTPVTTATGTLYYYVIISNSNSCAATGSASGAVTVNALPTVSTPATTPVSYCRNATATALSVTGTAGSGTISSYAWYSNTTQSNSGGALVATHTSSSTTDTYTPVTTTAGILYYYVIITNSNNCTATSSASGAVTVNALPTVTAPATTPVSYCLNATATALSVNGTAGSGTISSYAWYSNTTQSNSGGTLLVTHSSSSTTDTYTPVTTSTGTLYYYVIISNSNSCTATGNASGAVTVNSLPATPTSPTATPSTICNGQSSTLSATFGGGETVDWYTVTCGGTAAGSPVSPTSTTTYYARARNTTTGCVSSACASVTVTVNALPSAPSGINASPASICNGSSSTISVTDPGPGYTTDWYTVSCGGTAVPGGTGVNSLSVSLNATTTYYARTRNTATGCVSANCVNVTVTIVTPGSQTFNSSGSFTVPTGVTQLTVECWGGGGKGGSWTNDEFNGGGGGGAGAYTKAYVAVTPGNNYNFHVGAGSNTTAAGENSWFGNSAYVVSSGGNSVLDNTSNGGSGGSASPVVNPVIASTAGGSGTNGDVGSGGDGGTSPNGGTGGAGGSYLNSPNNGNTPGGGGGGGYRYWFVFWLSGQGASGANGRVKISWTCAACPDITASVSGQDNISCYAGSGSITITASGGTAPYKFSLDNGATYVDGNTDETHTFTGLVAATYYPRVKDANDCESPSCP